MGPIYNADGNERGGVDNRGAQHGPIGGTGAAAQRDGLRSNRDHMKLDTPEARCWCGGDDGLRSPPWWTSTPPTGIPHAYHVNYSPPLHPNTEAGIDRFLRDRLFPRHRDHPAESMAATSTITATHDDPRTDQRAWMTFDQRFPLRKPSYVGCGTGMAILSEAYSYATFEETDEGHLLVRGGDPEILRSRECSRDPAHRGRRRGPGDGGRGSGRGG